MATRGRKRDQAEPVDEGRMLDRGVMKPYKLCCQCQRPMVLRKKWSDPKVWAEVKYCSDACRAASKASRGKTAPPEQKQEDS